MAAQEQPPDKELFEIPTPQKRGVGIIFEALL